MCPLCGKSSSLRTFPSGGGTDLLLQSFRGKGRGRGFEAIPAGSGLDDPALANAVHAKVVTILGTLESRGLPVPVQWTRDSAEDLSLRDRIATLERNVERERSARTALESRAKDLEGELERDRLLRLKSLALVGKLSQELDHAKAAQEELLAAARRCIGSLRSLRERLKGVPYAAQSLSPLVHDVKGLVELVQELRVISSLRSAATAADPFTR